MKQILWWWLGITIATVAGAAADPGEAIAALRSEIARHDELYHRRAVPEITDAEYDGLKRRLAELERRHPTAALQVPPLAAIGDDRTGRARTAPHLVPMLSLDKVYTAAELRAFDARLRKTLGREAVDYVIEPKYDGLAVSLVYERGKLVRAITRGNGREGDDVTANVRAIRGLPLELRGPAGPPERIEVRGEVYVAFADFETLNAERELAGLARFANPRNLAAGTLRQSDVAAVGERGLRVVVFGVGACDPAAALPATHRETQALFAAWGLPTVRNAWRAHGGEELERMIEAAGKSRAELPFPTDGAVVKVDALALQAELGAGDSAPRWAVAYKFPPERVETQVWAITLQVGRTGVMTPVAELTPVLVGGSTVARATLHNRDEIARLDVRVGDTVYLEKAGEVIPAITGVNHARRPASSMPYVFPSVCPECGGPVEVRPGEVAVRCGNAECPAQLRRRIEHYVSKDGVNIEGFGPSVVEAVVTRGWVRSVADLYRLTAAQLAELPRSSIKSAERLCGAIERSRTAELWRVISGLGIPQIGPAAAREKARKYGSLEAFAAAEPRGREAALSLVEAGIRPKVAAVTGGTALSGKTLVLTGTLPNLTRTQATEQIEAAGGRVAGSVTRTTDLVVVGAEPGTKLDQARRLGVATIDEAGLRELLEPR